MTKRDPIIIVLGLSVLFFIVFMVVAMGTLFHFSGSSSAAKKLFKDSANIGVVEIKGVILDAKKTTELIEKFQEEPTIKAVLVRVNSPGGAVAPSQEIYEAIKRLAKEKPVYTSMSSVAASGGYYVAAGTQKIFASPGTITGSIGVIMQFSDLSKLYQWAKVNPYSIKTGKYKDVGSTTREMTPEEKQLLQDMMNNVLGQFRKAVSEGRKLSMEKVVAISDGRIFSGEQAKAEGLVDELGGMSVAIEALAKEAKINGKPKLVYGDKKKGLWARVLSDLNDDDDEEEESSSSLLGRLLHRSIGSLAGRNFGGPSSAIFFLAPLGAGQSL